LNKENNSHHVSVYPSVGRDWNHELAAFRYKSVPAKRFGRPSGSALEPSDGRDCKFGSIRWPRPQKVIATATYIEQRVNDWRKPARGSEGQKPSREASDCTAIFAGSALAIAIKQLTANDGNNNRFCTVWNHPMAAHFWKHKLAKTAIGWVE
jgi:hypothetical protein